jgi:CheY-like chemotaxis protein
MNAKVLIVDDEKEFLEVMEERISARGMQVTILMSAKEALARIEKESFAKVASYQIMELHYQKSQSQNGTKDNLNC